MGTYRKWCTIILCYWRWNHRNDEVKSCDKNVACVVPLICVHVIGKFQVWSKELPVDHYPLKSLQLTKPSVTFKGRPYHSNIISKDAQCIIDGIIVLCVISVPNHRYSCKAFIYQISLCARVYGLCRLSQQLPANFVIVCKDKPQIKLCLYAAVTLVTSGGGCK